MSIVIVGAGECGARAAFKLRDIGFQGAITLIGAEADLPYERPPLSKSLDVNVRVVKPLRAFEQAGIDLCQATIVRQIDSRSQQVVLDDCTISYSKLLLATGARARVAPSLRDALTLRTVADAVKIGKYMKADQKIGIIGAGFIGLELAALARTAGAEVHVFEAGKQVLSRAVPAPIANQIAKRHLAEGVHLYMGATIESADATSIKLSDGLTVKFDCVIASVGAVPNVELAEQAHLDVGNGIKVDGNLRTSSPNIYAAGDCCNFPWRGKHLRMESWKCAVDQAEHVAASMLGADTMFDQVPWFWSDQYDLSLQVAGIFDPAQPIQERILSEHGKIAFQMDDTSGTVVAAASLSVGMVEARDFKIFQKLIERRTVARPTDIASAQFNLKTLLKAT